MAACVRLAARPVLSILFCLFLAIAPAIAQEQPASCVTAVTIRNTTPSELTVTVAGEGLHSMQRIPRGQSARIAVPGLPCVAVTLSGEILATAGAPSTGAAISSAYDYAARLRERNRASVAEAPAVSTVRVGPSAADVAGALAGSSAASYEAERARAAASASASDPASAPSQPLQHSATCPEDCPACGTAPAPSSPTTSSPPPAQPSGPSGPAVVVPPPTIGSVVREVPVDTAPGRRRVTQRINLCGSALTAGRWISVALGMDLLPELGLCGSQVAIAVTPEVVAPVDTSEEMLWAKLLDELRKQKEEEERRMREELDRLREEMEKRKQAIDEERERRRRHPERGRNARQREDLDNERDRLDRERDSIEEDRDKLKADEEGDDALDKRLRQEEQDLKRTDPNCRSAECRSIRAQREQVQQRRTERAKEAVEVDKREQKYNRDARDWNQQNQDLEGRLDRGEGLTREEHRARVERKQAEAARAEYDRMYQRYQALDEKRRNRQPMTQAEADELREINRNRDAANRKNGGAGWGGTQAEVERYERGALDAYDGLVEGQGGSFEDWGGFIDNMGREHPGDDRFTPKREAPGFERYSSDELKDRSDRLGAAIDDVRAARARIGQPGEQPPNRMTAQDALDEERGEIEGMSGRIDEANQRAGDAFKRREEAEKALDGDGTNRNRGLRDELDRARRRGAAYSEIQEIERKIERAERDLRGADRDYRGARRDADDVRGQMRDRANDFNEFGRYGAMAEAAGNAVGDYNRSMEPIVGADGKIDPGKVQRAVNGFDRDVRGAQEGEARAGALEGLRERFNAPGADGRTEGQRLGLSAEEISGHDRNLGERIEAERQVSREAIERIEGQGFQGKLAPDGRFRVETAPQWAGMVGRAQERVRLREVEEEKERLARPADLPRAPIPLERPVVALDSATAKRLGEERTTRVREEQERDRRRTAELERAASEGGFEKWAETNNRHRQEDLDRLRTIPTPDTATRERIVRFETSVVRTRAYLEQEQQRKERMDRLWDRWANEVVAGRRADEAAEERRLEAARIPEPPAAPTAVDTSPSEYERNMARRVTTAADRFTELNRAGRSPAENDVSELRRTQETLERDLMEVEGSIAYLERGEGDAAGDAKYRRMLAERKRLTDLLASYRILLQRTHEAQTERTFDRDHRRAIEQMVSWEEALRAVPRPPPPVRVAAAPTERPRETVHERSATRTDTRPATTEARVDTRPSVAERPDTGTGTAEEALDLPREALRFIRDALRRGGENPILLGKRLEIELGQLSRDATSEGIESLILGLPQEMRGQALALAVEALGRRGEAGMIEKIQLLLARDNFAALRPLLDLPVRLARIEALANGAPSEESDRAIEGLLREARSGLTALDTETRRRFASALDEVDSSRRLVEVLKRAIESSTNPPEGYLGLARQAMALGRLDHASRAISKELEDIDATAGRSERVSRYAELVSLLRLVSARLEDPSLTVTQREIARQFLDRSGGELARMLDANIEAQVSSCGRTARGLYVQKLGVDEGDVREATWRLAQERAAESLRELRTLSRLWAMAWMAMDSTDHPGGVISRLESEAAAEIARRTREARNSFANRGEEVMEGEPREELEERLGLIEASRAVGDGLVDLRLARAGNAREYRRIRYDDVGKTALEWALWGLDVALNGQSIYEDKSYGARGRWRGASGWRQFSEFAGTDNDRYRDMLMIEHEIKYLERRRFELVTENPHLGVDEKRAMYEEILQREARRWQQAGEDVSPLLLPELSGIGAAEIAAAQAQFRAIEEMRLRNLESDLEDAKRRNDPQAAYRALVALREAALAGEIEKFVDYLGLPWYRRGPYRGIRIGLYSGETAEALEAACADVAQLHAVLARATYRPASQLSAADRAFLTERGFIKSGRYAIPEGLELQPTKAGKELATEGRIGATVDRYVNAAFAAELAVTVVIPGGISARMAGGAFARVALTELLEREGLALTARYLVSRAGMRYIATWGAERGIEAALFTALSRGARTVIHPSMMLDEEQWTLSALGKEYLHNLAVLSALNIGSTGMGLGQAAIRRSLAQKLENEALDALFRITSGSTTAVGEAAILTGLNRVLTANAITQEDFIGNLLTVGMLRSFHLGRGSGERGEVGREAAARERYNEWLEAELFNPARRLMGRFDGNWNALRDAWQRKEVTDQEMRAVFEYRKRIIDDLAREIVEELGGDVQAFGSQKLSSDYDLSFVGPKAELAVILFNARFRARWNRAMEVGGAESASRFDVNFYTNPIFDAFRGGAEDIFQQDAFSHMAARKYMNERQWAEFKSQLLERKRGRESFSFLSLLIPSLFAFFLVLFRSTSRLHG